MQLVLFNVNNLFSESKLILKKQYAGIFPRTGQNYSAIEVPYLLLYSIFKKIPD